MKAEEIFLGAADWKTPAERAAYLDGACADNAELRTHVERLLKSHEEAGNFLEQPLFDPVPTIDQSRVAEVLGTVIGPYKLLQQIGEGGMGDVFMAEQLHPVQRKVAIKVIKAGMDSRQVIARFEVERQALAMMDHVNIARVLDAGTTEAGGRRPEAGEVTSDLQSPASSLQPAGRPYFVMELVHGVPITKYCDDNHLTPRERLELFVPVCQAIQHAHQKGIIHRDIKPSNVMITLYDGRPVPKVIDFGVAKATEQRLTERTLFTQYGMMVGTLEYMSPEQAEMSALGVDTRSDIYSLGVLLYELLTGSTPLSHKRLKEAAFGEVLRMIREEEPPKPSTRLSDSGQSLASISAQRHMEPAKLTKVLRGELDWIVMKTLEKNRNRRYETANGLAADVQRYLNDEAVQACPPSASYRLRKFVRRNKGPVAACAALAALLVLGTVSTSIGLAWALQAERTASVAAAAEARQRQDAETQRDRAVTAEGLAQTRLAQVTSEKQRADEERTKAVASEAETNAFSKFLVQDMLSVARPKKEGGGLGIDVTVKAALDAAATKIPERFAGQPRAEAVARHSVGVTYRLIGNLDSSEEQLRRAYDLRVETLGEDHEDTLNSANSLAVLYQARGELSKAESLYVRTLDVQRRVLGEEHPHTLLTMNNLAGLCKAQGLYAKAEPRYGAALEVQRRVLGEEHPDTLLSMSNLARLYQDMGQLPKAESLCLKTLEARRRVLGDEHPDTLMSMNNLAALYHARDAYADAEPLYVSTLEVRSRVLGEEHADTLVSMNNLAVLYKAKGQLDKAEPLYIKALEVSRRVLGDEHPNTLGFMSNLATLQQAQARYAEAEPLLVKTLEIRRRALGDAHPNTIASMGSLAGLYRAQSEFAKADPLYREALEKTRNRQGVPAPMLASALASLGLNLLQQEEYTQAEPLLRECLAIRERELPNAWNTFSAKSMLGGSLLGQRKLADPDLSGLLLAGYEGMKQRERLIPREFDWHLTDAIVRLVRLYDEWGDKNQADEWRKRLDARKEAKSKSATPE